MPVPTYEGHAVDEHQVLGRVIQGVKGGPVVYDKRTRKVNGWTVQKRAVCSRKVPVDSRRLACSILDPHSSHILLAVTGIPHSSPAD